ncbi:MAG TPA: SIMPL domain-containing protein [Candidatus Dormibacteraeota bacterium]|nr:SIMPL domain-containing protein [Candidatus Dormibacteraeota bacterium]
MRNNSLVTVGVAVACSIVVAAVVTALSRPVVLTGNPSAVVSSTITPAILTSGDATVTKKPDLAIVSAGVQSDQSTAAGAQSDLAAKAGQLISRIKALGVPDSDLSTAGYWVGPVYDPTGRSITGYRASEQLVAKWHTVDSVGKVLDAIVQEGGAMNISVSFGLNDPKPAQAEARALAIADAKAKASAMASSAGVRLGQVIEVSDLSTQARVPQPMSYAGAAAVPTQVPVGVLQIQVTVEVDFAIA